MKKVSLERFRPQFVKLVKEYMHSHRLNQTELSDYLGMGATQGNISNLLSGKRRLTVSTAIPFIFRGTMTVDQLKEGTPDSENTEIERLALEYLGIIANRRFLHKAAKAKQLGFDCEGVLDKFLETMGKK
jgi:transcriptional regulator with XRE-family HTH domain